MFSFSTIIIRTELYSIEIEKLNKDNMALVFAKLIIFFFKLRVGGWNCVFLLHHNCSRSQIGHAVVDLKLEVK